MKLKTTKNEVVRDDSDWGGWDKAPAMLIAQQDEIMALNIPVWQKTERNAV